MVIESVFAQIVHEVPSPSKSKASMGFTCSACGLIRDDTGPFMDKARWVTQRTYRTYREIPGVPPADCLLTHTYCPACFMQVMDNIRGKLDPGSCFSG